MNKQYICKFLSLKTKRAIMVSSRVPKTHTALAPFLIQRYPPPHPISNNSLPYQPIGYIYDTSLAKRCNLKDTEKNPQRSIALTKVATKLHATEKKCLWVFLTFSEDCSFSLDKSHETPQNSDFNTVLDNKQYYISICSSIDNTW